MADIAIRLKDADKGVVVRVMVNEIEASCPDHPACWRGNAPQKRSIVR